MDSSSKTKFSDVSYVQLTDSTAYLNNDGSTYRKFEYTKDSICEFSVYKIKVIFRSSNSVHVPSIKNFASFANYLDRSKLPLQAASITVTKNSISNSAYQTPPDTTVIDVPTDFVIDS